MSNKNDQNILPSIPFYFLRHGQTDYNIKRLFTGHHDIPLNDTGIGQARAAAQLLKNRGIQVIASSPLQRAFQTANIVAQELQVPIIVIDDLKEGNWGILQGKNIDDHAEHIDLWEKGAQLDQAELYKDFTNRVLRGTKQALHLTEPVLIVAHGGVFEEIQIALHMKRPPHGVGNAVPLLVRPYHQENGIWVAESIADLPNSEKIIEKQLT